MVTSGHLFLTGFMGSGKTVVGRSLADLLNWPFVDLDERIEQSTGQTIFQIFADRSEEGFRELESATLRSMASEVPTVVATGGGVPLRSANRSWMRQHGTTVWLDAPFELILTRLRREGSGARPLFGEVDRTRDLYDERRDRYGDADLRIEVLSSDSVVTVAARVRDRLVEQGCVT